VKQAWRFRRVTDLHPVRFPMISPNPTLSHQLALPISESMRIWQNPAACYQAKPFRQDKSFELESEPPNWILEHFIGPDDSNEPRIDGRRIHFIRDMRNGFDDWHLSICAAVDSETLINFIGY
jgi:hypothetical protein